MILHKMLFLHMPYQNTDDFTALHAEILNYRGFIATPEVIQTCERRHIPQDLLFLLERLLHLLPEQRPSAERVKEALLSRMSRLKTGRSKSKDASTSRLYEEVSFNCCELLITVEEETSPS